MDNSLLPQNRVSNNLYNISHIFKNLFKKESFLRPFIIFLSIYLFCVIQNWGSIIFLLFPIITFGFFTFLKVVELFKEYTNVNGSNLYFNPLGNEGIIANRLIFCTLLQLIIVFAMGTESLYHPQLINDYFIFYVLPEVLIFIFSIYYSLYDLGMNATIGISLKTDNSSKMNAENIDLYLMSSRKEKKGTTNSSEQINMQKGSRISEPAIQKVISHLNVNDYIKIFNLVKLVTIIFVINWVLWLLLTYLNLVPGILFGLPGSILTEGNELEVTVFIFPVLAGIPICFIYILIKTYQLNTQIDIQLVTDAIKELPVSQQQKIMKLLEIYFIKNKQLNEKGRTDF